MGRFNHWILLNLICGLLTTLSCSNKINTVETADQSLTAAVESSITEIGNAASLSESAATPSLTAACNYTSVRSACSAGHVTLNWAGCTVGSSTLTGGWNETFKVSGAANCAAQGNLTSSGNRLERTTILVSPEIITSADGSTVTTDTAGGYTWDGAHVINPKITIEGGSTRTITNTGVHRVMRTSGGRKVYDHFLIYTAQVTGTSRADRQVSGTSTVYHNLLRYIAVHTFNGSTPAGTGVASQALTYDVGCCYPVGGKIVTTYGNSRFSVVDFTPGATTCGDVTLTNLDGKSSTVTLAHCK